MKLDEAKLQEVVEKIACQQFGQEQIDDLYAKMGLLNEYVQEQLRLFAVSNRREQLLAYVEYQNSEDYIPETKIDDEVDKFIANNCC